MIRETHPGTKVQRADKAEAAPVEVRRRGFEPADVPAGRVGLALILLYVFLSLSGAAVAGLLLLFEGTGGGQPAPVFAPTGPPPPRLEIDPLADRLALEAPAKARLREHGGRQRQGGASTLIEAGSIEDAMRAVAAEGWRDSAPPPGQAETAKAHAERAR